MIGGGGERAFLLKLFLHYQDIHGQVWTHFTIVVLTEQKISCRTIRPWSLQSDDFPISNQPLFNH